MKILLVVGTRPNLMKIAPIIRELELYNIEYILVHTGQHYDSNMSELIIDELKVPRPQYNLGIKSGTHGEQTSKLIRLFEPLCIKESPDVVLVVGDVNSTLACAIVVSKLDNIKLAHVEAGCRSFDRSMPEEINRVVTDVLSDYLFCIDQESADNLIKNKDIKGNIHVVGDVMVDSLLYNTISNLPIGLPYILVTIHRASNTDTKNNLEKVLTILSELAERKRIVFPIHPRTRCKIDEFNLNSYLKNIEVYPAFSYLKFLQYMKHANLVITDSGSIQVETTILDIPCLTVRDNTERNFTTTEGTNILVGTNKSRIIDEVNLIYAGNTKHTNLSIKRSKVLDGKASERIVNILTESIN